MPVRVLTSPSAIKAYLSTILFLTSSLVLLTISTTAYGFFYYNYIPQINFERAIYLQYGLGTQPHAVASLDTSALISQQAYDIDLVLHMPRTPANLATGNFMLDLSLLGPGTASTGMSDSFLALLANMSAGTVLHHSRRPAILPFASPLLSLSHTFLQLPWHSLGLRDLDSDTLVVPMFELVEFPRGSRNIPTHVRLELQSDMVLQVYSAKIVFRARFHGMRYLIYNHRILAFIVFSTVFYVVSILSMSIAWAVISRRFPSKSGSADGPGRTVKREPGSETGRHVKTEPESHRLTKFKIEDDAESSGHGLSLSNISDTATQSPTTKGPPALKHSARSRRTVPQDAEADAGLEDLTRPLGSEQVADDENEEEEDEGEEEEREETLPGRGFGDDSGIGTSLEGETSSLTRRRSRPLDE